jgi:DNA modification methylase
MIDLIHADALVWLDKQSSKPPLFDLVVTDPPYDSLLKWQGIGTTPAVCAQHGRTCIGIDISERAMEHAKLRLDIFPAIPPVKPKTTEPMLL